MSCTSWRSTKDRTRFALHDRLRAYDTIGRLAQTDQLLTPVQNPGLSGSTPGHWVVDAAGASGASGEIAAQRRRPRQPFTPDVFQDLVDDLGVRDVCDHPQPPAAVPAGRERLLVARPVQREDRLVAVLDWFEELERLAPTRH